MKILVLGDPHFKKDNLHFMKWTCQETLDIIDSEKPDLCVCLGDTLDTHERVTLRPLHMATKFFFDISDRCPLVVIIGNHDRENNNDFCTDIHPFIGMTRTPNITIVDDAYWDHDLNFLYVPYVYPGRFLEAMSRAGYSPAQNDTSSSDPSTDLSSELLEDEREEGEKGKDDKSPETPKEETQKEETLKEETPIPRLIFTHQEFKGSRINTGIVSKDGDYWSPEWPLVISGHIHEHQTLPQVVYAGTFIQQSYGESPDKALLMLHLDENNFDAPKIQRIPLTSIYYRQTIDLSLKDLDNYMEYIPYNSIKSSEIKSSETKVTGVLVRVRLHVDATETKSLKTNSSYIALESSVDKVDVVTDSSKTSIAKNIIENLRQNGIDKVTITLEQVVQELLKDDPEALQVFLSEFLQT